MKILISGGTNGIGLAFVKKYQNSHKITVICRDKKKAEALLEMYDIGIIYCDLADHSQVVELIDDLYEPFDIFINNAGTAPSRKLVDCKGKHINRCQMVNLVSPYIIISHFLENNLVKKVITLNSMTQWNGKIPYIGEHYSESYSNSKMSMMSLHTYWSENYPDVSFISINPGYVDTGIWHPNAFGESIHKHIRFIFASQPHEIQYLFDCAFEYENTYPVYISANSSSELFEYLSKTISYSFMLCNDFFGKTFYKTGDGEVIDPCPYSQLQHTIDSVVRFCSQFA